MQHAVLSGIRPSFPSLSRSAGQITHVLLTRSPLEHPASRAFPFDLHVLSTPPAFVLSQDQTLQTKTPGTKSPAEFTIRENLTKARHQKLASKKQPHSRHGAPTTWPKKQQQKQNHKTRSEESR